LEPAEARPTAAALAARAHAELPQAGTAPQLTQLGKVLAAARRLSPEESRVAATALAQKILGKYQGNKNVYAAFGFARAAAATADALDEAEANRLTDLVVDHLFELMPRAPDPDARTGLAAHVVVVAEKLRPGKAAAVARTTLALMAKPNEPATRHLLLSLDVLAGRLPRQEAAAFLTAVLEHPHLAARLGLEPPLARAVEKAAALLGPDETPALAQKLLDRLAVTDEPGQRAALTRVLRAVVGRQSGPELARALAAPTCVLEGREVVLGKLGQLLQRPFRDGWEFADWAIGQEPGWAVAAPPTRLGR
jgi:hypothetical protein